MVLDAIKNDDFEFIEKCINQHADSMATIADKLELLTKAFTSGSVKTFQALVTKLDFPDKALQLSEIEILIKKRLLSLTEADEKKVCHELDMVAAFSCTKLEDELYGITQELIDASIHILIFKAYLRANRMTPYDYLQLVQSEKEKILCLQLLNN